LVCFPTNTMNNEEMAFPTLFPSGSFGFDCHREKKISLNISSLFIVFVGKHTNRFFSFAWCQIQKEFFISTQILWLKAWIKWKSC
jgi:hypothetical protein